MESWTGAFIIMHVLSLAVMLVIFLQFRRIGRKYRTMFEVLEGGCPAEITRGIKRWSAIYVTTTLVITVATSFIFIWQPHVF